MKGTNVRVKLIGGLSKSTSKSPIEIELPEPSTISNLIKYLATSYGLDFGYFFSRNTARIDETLTLIIINGREINTLEGLETKIKNGDLVAFIPVAHGG